MLDVDDVIAIAEHEWRSIGVIERDRTTLLARRWALAPKLGGRVIGFTG